MHVFTPDIPGPYLEAFPGTFIKSWKDENIPNTFHNWPASWKHHNPEWTYTLWTDEANRHLVERHYPWFLEAYDALDQPVMKADAVRYLYLHR